MDREYVLGGVPSDINEMSKKKKALPPRVVRVPPFVVLEKNPAKDKHYTQQDAQRHADMIRRVWQKAGHNVFPEIDFCYRGGKKCWFVRMPDLINGLPATVFTKGMKS